MQTESKNKAQGANVALKPSTFTARAALQPLQDRAQGIDEVEQRRRLMADLVD